MKATPLVQAAILLMLLTGCNQRAVTEESPAATSPRHESGEGAKHWAGFRGLEHAGISPFKNIPTTFDLAKGTHVLWKASTPEGASSPIVWGNKLFLTASDGNADVVLCLDTATGTEAWKQTLAAAKVAPQVGNDTGFAAPTPVTDGQRVYALFASGNLAALDFAGQLAWSKNLGPFKTVYGYASSPVLAGDRLILQLDLGEAGKSYLLALEGQSGKELWKTPRPIEHSWTTPAVFRHAERDLVVTTAMPQAIAYDAKDGKELWRIEGLGRDAAPSPLCFGGFILLSQSNEKLAALSLDDSCKPKVLWAAEGSMPAVCSPVSDGQQVILLSNDGLLQSFSLQDGKKLWERDLDVTCYASPSLVNGNIYLFSKDEPAAMIVVPATQDTKPPLKSDLGQRCVSSPAFQDGRMYVRCQKTLFCIGQR